MTNQYIDGVKVFVNGESSRVNKMVLYERVPRFKWMPRFMMYLPLCNAQLVTEVYALDRTPQLGDNVVFVYEVDNA